MIRRAIATALGVALALACGESRDEAPDVAATRGTEAEKSTLESLESYTFEKREELAQAFDRRVEQLTNEARELRDRARMLPDEARESAERAVEATEEKLEAARDQADQIRDAGADAWDDTRAAAKRALEEAEQALESASRTIAG